MAYIMYNWRIIYSILNGCMVEELGGGADRLEHLKSENRRLKESLSEIRRYVAPMNNWSDLDAHVRGYIQTVLNIVDDALVTDEDGNRRVP